MAYIGFIPQYVQNLDTITNPSKSIDVGALEYVIEHHEEEIFKKTLRIFEKRKDAISIALSRYPEQIYKEKVSSYYIQFIMKHWTSLDEEDRSKIRSLILERVYNKFDVTSFAPHCDNFIELLKKDYPLPIQDPLGPFLKNFENPDISYVIFAYSVFLCFSNKLCSTVYQSGDNNIKLKQLMNQSQVIASKLISELTNEFIDVSTNLNALEQYTLALYHLTKFVKSEFFFENDLIRPIIDYLNSKFIKNIPFREGLTDELAIQKDRIQIQKILNNLLRFIGSFFIYENESLSDEQFKILFDCSFPKLIQKYFTEYNWINVSFVVYSALYVLESLLITSVQRNITEIPDVDIALDLLVDITRNYCGNVKKSSQYINLFEYSITDDIVFKQCLSIISKMLNLTIEKFDDQSNILIQEKYISFISHFLRFFVDDCISYKSNPIYDLMDFSQDEFMNDEYKSIKMLKREIIHNAFASDYLDFEEIIFQQISLLSYGYEKSKYESLVFILLSLSDMFNGDEMDNSELLWKFMDLTTQFLESKNLSNSALTFILQVFYKFLFVFPTFQEKMEQYFDIFLKFLVINNVEFQRVSINSFLRKIYENGSSFINNINEKHSMPYYMILVSKNNEICSKLISNDLIHDFLDCMHIILFKVIDHSIDEKEKNIIFESVQKPIFENLNELMSNKTVNLTEWINSFDLYFTSITIVAKYDKSALPYFNSNYFQYIDLFIELTEEVKRLISIGDEYSLQQKIRERIVQYFIDSINISDKINDPGIPIILIDIIVNDFINSPLDIKIENVLELINILLDKCSELFAAKIEGFYKPLIQNLSSVLLKEFESKDDDSNISTNYESLIQQYLIFLNQRNSSACYIHYGFEPQIIRSFILFLWKSCEVPIFEEMSKGLLKNALKEVAEYDVFLLIHDVLDDIISTTFEKLLFGLENNLILLNIEIIQTSLFLYTLNFKENDENIDFFANIHAILYKSLYFYDDETRNQIVSDLIQSSNSEETFYQQMQDILIGLLIVEPSE